MPEEIGCQPSSQSRSVGNMTNHSKFEEKSRINHYPTFTPNSITSPKGSIKLINHSRQTTLSNGTHHMPEKLVTTAMNGDSTTNNKSKKTKAKPLSIPASPTIAKHIVQDLRPSRVGKYMIIRTLGRGNFAQVKLAIHVTTGREVAIKMIDKTSLNENCRIKLAREVRVLKTLTHPNIVRLYEVIETTHHVYLVMEYAKNGEVFEHLLKAGRMAETKVRVLFRQLFSAVEYCHQKNIVHRDLKAENLLLDENNNLKLADFGFANTFDTGNSLDTFCGSPPYAAPELLCGQKYHGPEVDVWALGVILYMLVCGQLPFEAFTLKELHARVLSGKYRIPFYMSGACEGMLKKMLVLNPTKRATLKELMKEEWINIGYENEPLRPFVEPKQNYNDPIRRAIMSELGFDPADLKDAFENHRFNNITATYLLLEDTETRHKLTRKLQNEYESPRAVSQLRFPSDQEADSSDEDPRCDLRQLSHSAITSNGKVSRATGSWRTGSLRDDSPQRKSNFCLKPNKQLCRPSLNLPSLIATSERSDGSLPRFPVNLELTSKGARSSTLSRTRTVAVADVKPTDPSDNDMDSVAPPTPNGLRRFRTPSLEKAKKERQDQSNEGALDAVTVKKSHVQETNKPDGKKTDPLSRRDFKQLMPARRSHSVVIVSDEDKDQSSTHKTLDSLRKLPRVISPAETKLAESQNAPVDLLNPSERTKYLYSVKYPATRPPTHKVQLRRYATYTEGDSERPESGSNRSTGTKVKPVLSRWVHVMSPDHRKPNNSESVCARDNDRTNVIIITGQVHSDVSKTARGLTPEVKPSPNARRPVWRQHSDLSNVNSTLFGLNGIAADQQTSSGLHSRADRMPKWRRYTTEFSKISDKPPTSTDNAAPGSQGLSRVRAQPSDTEQEDTDSSERTYTTVVRPVHGTGQISQISTAVLSNGRHTPTASTRNSPVMRLHLFRNSRNGTPTENRLSDQMDPPTLQNSKAFHKLHNGQSFLVFSAPRSEMNSSDRAPNPNGSIFNGTPTSSHASQLEFTGNRSLVSNGPPVSCTPSRTPTPAERTTPTPSNIRRSTQLSDSPSHYRWWYLKSPTNSASLQRSQSHRDTPEMVRPIPTPVKATPDFTRRYNGTPTTASRESQNIEYGRHPSSYNQQQQQQQQTGNAEKRGTENSSYWQSPRSTNPSVKNRTFTGPTVVPRQQNWAFGIAIQGRNAQVLMLSILRILEDNQIEYVYLNPYRLMCTYPPAESAQGHRSGQAGQVNKVSWEIEVVHLPQMETYGVRFKYISGPTTQYRTLEKSIIEEFPQTDD